MSPKIDPTKTIKPLSDNKKSVNNARLNDMEQEISSFFYMLNVPNENFDVEKAFDILKSYIKNHERILYSVISNIIYERLENGEDNSSGRFLSNIEKLVAFSETVSISDPIEEGYVKNTKKAIIKIWDHVSLADHQYTMLKFTDSAYNDKFKENIQPFKETLTKEMNAQMITMISIFTALAFLLFGGISSLDDIFVNIELPLFKATSIGLIWGIGLSNMIFVFLYCIGKITKLKFNATDNPDATVFERYPVVWWTNFILIALLFISIWLWFIQQTSLSKEIIDLTNHSPKAFLICGSIVIIVGIGTLLCLLVKYTKHPKRPNKHLNTKE